MEDLKEKTIRGGLAKVVAQGANFTLRLGSLVVMARLLEPRDFGLVAMVTAVTGVLNLFRDFGLSTATVQRPDITNEQISTLFWINLLVGAMLSCVALIGAPFLASFYQEPRLFWITVALAAGFLFNAAGVQHNALLQRQMRFTTLAAIETGALFASIAVGIGMGLSGLGYWSLVGMALTTPLVTSTSVWLAVAWIPARPRRNIGVGSMIRFGGTVTMNGLVVYVAYNLDKVLLGRFWGASALGVYERAYNLANIPTENLNSAVGQVAFSALSRLNGDPVRLRNYFLKGYTLLLGLTVPITMLCAIFANELILLLLGPKWAEVGPILRLLAPSILAFAMINPFYSLLLSVGKAGRSLAIAVVIAPLVIGAYLIGLPHGPQGVALSYSLALGIWIIPHILWCVKGTVVSFSDIIRAISQPLFSGIAAAMVALATVLHLDEALSPFQLLAAGTIVFVIVYASILLLFFGQKSLYVELVRAVARRRHSEQPVPPANSLRS